MAASIASSIIFFLLFITILSHFLDVSVFAAQMEHRKLGGVKETMTMRRNLEENSPQSAGKTGVHGSYSGHTGSKTANNVPSQTHPDQATPQKKQISYGAVKNSDRCLNSPCTGTAPKTYSRCDLFHRCTHGSSTSSNNTRS